MDIRDCWRGLHVIWSHVPRGGYGFEHRIPAYILRVTAKRVVIELEGPSPAKRVTVSPNSLRAWDRYVTVAGDRTVNRMAGGKRDGAI